jgi:hypothetical protein
MIQELVSSLLPIVKEWQELVSGLIGFTAAIIAVRYTYLTERKRQAAEARALRQGLGIEFRDMAKNALRAFEECIRCADSPKGVSAGYLDDKFRFPQPIIYRQVAGRVAEVGEKAYAVVYFYAQLEVALDAVRRLMNIEKEIRSHTVLATQILEVARSLLQALTAAREAIPTLEPINSTIAAADATFLADVDGAISRHRARLNLN